MVIMARKEKKGIVGIMVYMVILVFQAYQV